jgi:hypothetical protein
MEVSMPQVKLHLEQDYPVKKKVEILQNFLGENYFHDNGIMYCMWHYKDGIARPFEPEDYGDYEFAFLKEADCSIKGWLESENSSSTSGLFLASQSLRYIATGEPQAMEYAKKAFNSIKIIMQMTLQDGQPGFLTKPWDWKVTTGTSPDQYICVMHGLWQYRKIADFQDRIIINKLLPQMADWWRNRDYTLVFHETKWPILPHHSPAMACLHSMSYKITQDQLYLDECKRLLTIAEAWPTWIDRNRRQIYHPTGWPVEKKGVRWPKELYGREYDPSRREFLINLFEVQEIWLTIVCADYFMTEDPVMSELLKHAISRHQKYIQFGMRDDYLTYYTIQVDLERDYWTTIKRKDDANLGFTAPTENRCWLDGASRIPDASIIGHKHAPEFCPGALKLARNMLKTLDDRRLHWYADPEDDSFNDDEKWMLDILSSDVPSFTILAYWRAKLYGIDW